MQTPFGKVYPSGHDTISGVAFFADAPVAEFPLRGDAAGVANFLLRGFRRFVAHDVVAFPDAFDRARALAGGGVPVLATLGAIAPITYNPIAFSLTLKRENYKRIHTGITSFVKIGSNIRDSHRWRDRKQDSNCQLHKKGKNHQRKRRRRAKLRPTHSDKMPSLSSS